MSGSGSTIDRAATVRAPSSGTALQLIAGTGSTEAHNSSTALTHGKYASLWTGAAAVRVKFAGAASQTSQVTSTSLLIAANTHFPDWQVVKGVDDYVYVEAEDGSSAFQVWIWESSP